MNSVSTNGEDQPEKFQSSKSPSCSLSGISHRRRCLLRLQLLLSIFVVQSTIFVTLAGHAMTVSSASSFAKKLPISIKTTNSTTHAQVSEPLCPPPDPNSLDPWACDLDRAQRLLPSDKDFGEERICRNRPFTPAEQFIKIISPATECLIISDPHRHVRDLCSQSPIFRREQSGQLVLSFCHQYSLFTLADGSWISANTTTCQSLLRPLLDDIKRKDAQARRLGCEFDVLLARYNCQSGYSVKWSCNECSKIYRSWTCSMVLTFFDEGRPRKPCRSFCQQVEQTCPYFHPAHRDQYAGEPAFICIDPQIPFIPSLTPVVPFDDSLACYDECDLEFTQHNCSRSRTHFRISDCKKKRRERLVKQRSSTSLTSSTTFVDADSEFSLVDDVYDEHELDLSISNPSRVADNKT